MRLAPRRTRTRTSRPPRERVLQFVDSATTGDDLAWAGLVEEFRNLIAGVARAHYLKQSDAADVAQETWLRLFRRVAHLRDPAYVGSWLATTAGRQCLRVLRHGARQIPTDDPGGGVDDAPVDAELMTAARERRAVAGVRAAASLG